MAARRTIPVKIYSNCEHVHTGRLDGSDRVGASLISEFRPPTIADAVCGLGNRCSLASVHRLLPALALVALPGFAIAAEPKSPLANFPTAREAQRQRTVSTAVVGYFVGLTCGGAFPAALSLAMICRKH